MARILVAYATQRGSTADIAAAVAMGLEAAGHTADVREITGVTTLAGYAGVVLGGPMYMGRMDGRVGRFAKDHIADLVKVPIAGFIVCLAAASKDPEGMAWAGKALHKALYRVQPVTGAIFASRLDPDKLSWFQRWIIMKVKSPVGDFRDWGAITVWARDLPGR